MFPDLAPRMICPLQGLPRMTTGLVLWLLGQCHVKVLGSPPGVPGPLHKPFPSSDQEKNLAAIMSLGLPHSRSPGSGLCTAGSVLCFLPCSHYLPVSATTCPGSAPRCCCVLWPQAGPALRLHLSHGHPWVPHSCGRRWEGSQLTTCAQCWPLFT